jgi:GAF domain-containing protein
VIRDFYLAEHIWNCINRGQQGACELWVEGDDAVTQLAKQIFSDMGDCLQLVTIESIEALITFDEKLFDDLIHKRLLVRCSLDSCLFHRQRIRFSDGVKTLGRNQAKPVRQDEGKPLGVMTIRRIYPESQWQLTTNRQISRDCEGTPLEWSLCRHVVRNQSVFVVSDARENEIVKDNPLVQSGCIRCYAGSPLITSKGNLIGSFCVMGEEVHVFTTEDVDFLRGMAAEAVRRIEARVAHIQ